MTALGRHGSLTEGRAFLDQPATSTLTPTALARSSPSTGSWNVWERSTAGLTRPYAAPVAVFPRIERIASARERGSVERRRCAGTP